MRVVSVVAGNAYLTAGMMILAGGLLLVLAVCLGGRIWTGPQAGAVAPVDMTLPGHMTPQAGADPPARAMAGVRSRTGSRVAATAAGPPAGVKPRPSVDLAALSRQVNRLAEHAMAAAARAAEAAAAVQAARDRHTVAETMREAAWHAYDTAESPVLVNSVGSAAGGGTGNGSAAGHLGGSAELAHAAFLAFRRGDISIEELRHLWQGPDVDAAPDPRLAEARERAGRQRAAQRDYHRAAAAARLAAEELRVAEVAAAALAAEARDAENDARRARDRWERLLRGRTTH